MMSFLTQAECLSIFPSLRAILRISAVIFALLYWFNTVFRFWVKYIFYLIWFMIIGVAVIVPSLFDPGNCDNARRWAGLFTRLTAKHIFGIKVKVEGWEHLKLKGPFIIVCNHQSSLDNVGMMEIIPRDTACMMKSSLKYAGPFGLAAILCGSIFVDRSNPEKAKKSLENTVAILKRDQIRLWMFPEGHRKLNSAKDQEEPLMPFKKGAFNLAVKAQIPLVPVIFSSQEPFFSFKQRKFTTGVQAITILPPIPTEGLQIEDVVDLSDRIRNQMTDIYVKISNLERSTNAKTNGLHSE